VLIDAVNVFLARRSSQKGFTLVELLVVISIIGVLATLVLLQLGTARAKSRDAKRISDVNQIRSAVEQYFEDHDGKYPTAITSGNLSKYMTNIPVDPLSGAAYGYAFDPTVNPIRFQIRAELEGTGNALKSDADIDSSGWETAGVDASDTATTEACANATLTDGDCVYDQGTN
jgi:prepilin-type N-terminal cleavage/methylation domain-containing protein